MTSDATAPNCPSLSKNIFILGLALLAPLQLWATEDRPGFRSLVEGRRMVEEVYWKHRIWPRADAPKPKLADVLPEDVLRRRVEDSLRMSTALAERWNQPITRQDLQTELDRMVRQSAAPDVLQELFEALGHDPQLIAECLARPLLASRRARQAYAEDGEIHAEVRARAEAAVRNISSAESLRSLGGRYTELEWVRWGNGISKHELLNQDGSANRLVLNAEEWKEFTDQLDSGILGTETGRVGPLREEQDRFVISVLLHRTPDSARIASATWAKTDFDHWWSTARADYEATLPEPASDLHLSPKAVTDIPPNSWATVSTTGSVPGARSRHTVVWTGSEMIIWGGAAAVEGVYYNGSLYDPATDSWSAMTTTNHPDGRADHTAVWDGSRMIIWGGWSGSLLNSGGSYSPSANTWTATDTSEAPVGRRYHSAVIDNSGYMLVWGGWDGSNYIGGACNSYKASIDDWMTGPSTNAPSARMDHGAVFITADNKMMVWGGENGSGVLGTGATYNRLNNTWLETTTSGAPSARTGHSMTNFPSSHSVDRGVLIWGGYNGSYTVTSGALYETMYPQSWRATSYSGAPSARMGHTAVATDHTIIIWGGASGSYLRNSGGVYNPFNNVWKSTSTTGAPSARELHTAIWREQSLATTNGEMIIWGGDDGGATSTGGRYSEPTDFVISAALTGKTVVPGGTHYDLFRTWVNSLGDFSSPVSLSCSMATLGCSFETNPVTPLPNASTYPDVTLSPDFNLAVGEYDFNIVGTSGGVTRSYPFTVVVRDFDLECSQDTVQVEPGGQVNAGCQVNSLNGFNDAVDLACTSFACVFSPDTVTPPADGNEGFTVSFTAPSTPGSYLEEMAATNNGALRIFELTIEVTDDDEIFSDGFESNDTSGWSGSFGVIGS